MMRLTLAALLLIGGTTMAMAEDPPIDCAKAENQNDMNTCAEDDYNKADKELNAVYKKAMASQVALDEQSDETDAAAITAVKELKKAQRAWIDYRDGHCDGYGLQAAGGSMQPLLVFGCKARLTQNRVKELKEMIEGLDN